MAKAIAKPILVDTGPLVALLREDDAFHPIAVKAAGTLPYPFMTTWAVLTETAWLLRNVPQGLDALLKLVESGMIELKHIPREAIGAVRARGASYVDLQPQLADLTLCWLAEQIDSSVIFTFDRRDFLVYRTNSGKPFSIVPE